MPLSRSIGGWATPESGKKAGTTGFTKELNAFLLEWSLFLQVCIYTGFPSTVFRGGVILSDLQHEIAVEALRCPGQEAGEVPAKA